MFDHDQFSARTRHLPEAARQRAASAYAVFGEMDMPAETEEVWRYVDLGFSLDDYSLPEPPAGGPATEDPGFATAGVATIVDGTVTAVDGEGLTSGVISQGPVEPDHDVFAAAAAAFGSAGVGVTVPAGQVMEAPYLVDVRAVTEKGFSAPSVEITVGRGAVASIIVALGSADDVDALAVPQIVADVGDGAILDMTTVQRWSYTTRSVCHQRVGLARDALLRFGEVGIGGALSRLHLIVDMCGVGSSAEISGAYFGEQTQTLDYRYFMNHRAARTRSDMFLKGALEDEAMSVFTGLIRIEPEAQKTEAFQTNRNLVLSPHALANSVPNLEILADDVRCGHGSTVGPLDEEQRYYLQSRGLDAERADRVQVRGFFEEALGRLPHSQVVDDVRRHLNDKYVRAQQQGRL
ncbi:MAG: Fe-S cluster assembly protein SufD [Acidimicrobiia bacterium]